MMAAYHAVLPGSGLKGPIGNRCRPQTHSFRPLLLPTTYTLLVSIGWLLNGRLVQRTRSSQQAMSRKLTNPKKQLPAQGRQLATDDTRQSAERYRKTLHVHGFKAGTQKEHRKDLTQKLRPLNTITFLAHHLAG